MNTPPESPVKWCGGESEPTRPLQTRDIPLSLYVHLPWCARKCPYCDFNSHRAPTDIPEREYIAALLQDAETLPPLIWGRRVRTLFIGGGTPSLFSPAAVDSLLCGLRALSLLTPDTEITLEANPDSADVARFSEFASVGINRLSLGAQSFDDDMLTAIGRIHNGDAARRAASAAAQTFANFNIDLMHALPAQTSAMAAEDINIALSFSPPHLSLYQLTLESGTPFFRHPPANLPSADDAAEISDVCMTKATSAGLQRYEVSAFAVPGSECQHNLNYWEFGDYLGIGAGAHDKITGEGKISRRIRIKNPRDYMRHAIHNNVVLESREVSTADAAFEFMLGVLRLSGGFTPSMLSERAGVALSDLHNIIAGCEQDGLLACDAKVIKPTAKGLRYLNEMLVRFLPEEDGGQSGLKANKRPQTGTATPRQQSANTTRLLQSRSDAPDENVRRGSAG